MYVRLFLLYDTIIDKYISFESMTEDHPTQRGGLVTRWVGLHSTHGELYDECLSRLIEEIPYYCNNIGDDIKIFKFMLYSHPDYNIHKFYIKDGAFDHTIEDYNLIKDNVIFKEGKCIMTIYARNIKYIKQLLYFFVKNNKNIFYNNKLTIIYAINLLNILLPNKQTTLSNDNVRKLPIIAEPQFSNENIRKLPIVAELVVRYILETAKVSTNMIYEILKNHQEYDDNLEKLFDNIGL